MSIWTMPRSLGPAQDALVERTGEDPWKEREESNRKRGFCAAVPDSDTNRVFVWLPRAQDRQDLRRRRHQGGEDEIGSDRRVL